MHIAVLGAGSVGHGIAQVSAMAGHDIVLRDIEAEFVEDGLEGIRDNLQDGVDRDKLTEEAMDATLERIEGTTDLDVAVEDADLVEIIVAEQTDERTEQIAVDYVQGIDKEDVVVVRDTAGFATSRLGLVTGLEAI